MRFDLSNLNPNLFKINVEEIDGIKYKVIKYKKKVFFDNLWSEDERLLETRGLVLEDSTDFIIARPFKKIFNIGENNTSVPWGKNLLFVEKKNGFMIAVTPLNNGKLLYSTTGSLTSKYVELAKSVLEPIFKGKENILRKQTYLFEICHPDDPHIVDDTKEGKPTAYYLGQRGANGDLGFDIETMVGHFPEIVHAKKVMINNEEELNTYKKTNKKEGLVIYKLNSDDYHLMYEPIGKIKTNYYLSKKALQRLGSKQAEMMFKNSLEFRKRLDEEFYTVLGHILATYTYEQWIGMSEVERSKILEKIIEGQNI